MEGGYGNGGSRRLERHKNLIKKESCEFRDGCGGVVGVNGNPGKFEKDCTWKKIFVGLRYFLRRMWGPICMWVVDVGRRYR